MSESKAHTTSRSSGATTDGLGGGQGGAPGAELSTDERERLEAEIRAELEAEHLSRLERVARRREELAQSRELRHERSKQAEVARMREDVRRRFYQERGYERIEEHGRERWIPREEYELRTRGKAPRIRNTRAVGARTAARYRWVPLYVLLILIATALGAMVVR